MLPDDYSDKGSDLLGSRKVAYLILKSIYGTSAHRHVRSPPAWPWSSLRRAGPVCTWWLLRSRQSRGRGIRWMFGRGGAGGAGVVDAAARGGLRSGRVGHDAVVVAAGSGAAGAGAVAAEHLRGGPAVQLHQVTLSAAVVQPAPVPTCAGECRFVRGDFVGNHATDPDLWGFCGAEDTQLNQVSRPSGAPGQGALPAGHGRSDRPALHGPRRPRHTPDDAHSGGYRASTVTGADHCA